MGASSSRQDGSEHVFAADTPVRFSQNVVDSLQTSSQTDSTRAKNIELQIQSRVTAELERLLESSSDSLKTASEAASHEEAQTQHASEQPSKRPFTNRMSEKLFGSDNSNTSKDKDKDLDRTHVSNEIEELRKKLSKRKQTTEMDKDVAHAKDAVVTCLRLNDRRPLDCWAEVERFKSEVGRLEKSFVDSQSA
ncbi:MAG: hypothetical protein M1828_004522 [Chrysothrix sp. TS-e1954]|nr:MAG: hypothetical protein M1828_004522 [Chrysothrix sp. TS-e1954]